MRQREGEIVVKQKRRNDSNLLCVALVIISCFNFIFFSVGVAPTDMYAKIYYHIVSQIFFLYSKFA